MLRAEGLRRRDWAEPDRLHPSEVLLSLSLEAGEKPGGRIRFPGEHGEGTGAATEALRDPLKRAKVETDEKVPLPKREGVVDPALLEGDHRQRTERPRLRLLEAECLRLSKVRFVQCAGAL